MKIQSFKTGSALSLLLFTAGCASLEERLCNQTTAFQKGYDDVINGRQDSPGLREGESCKESKNYAHADFHRDYMAGFNKAKLSHCTQKTAIGIGQGDAAGDKPFKASMPKLSICVADEKYKINFENAYETGYRKEFCKTERAQSYGTKDAAGLGEASRSEDDFKICAYQKAALFKTYKDTYRAEIRKQCSPGRAGSLGAMHARERKSLPAGLELIERCPSELTNAATQSYTVAFQSERSTMMEEERIRIEQQRLAQERVNRDEMLKLQRRQVEIEEQRLANEQKTP